MLAAIGSIGAIVVALAEGAMTAIVLAARHPESVAALALINATPGPSVGPLARRGEGPHYIEYLRYYIEYLRYYIEYLRSTLPQGWTPDLPGLDVIAPSLGRAPTFSAWLTNACRQAGDARRFLRAFDLARRSDLRAYRNQVRAPTLVVHRRADRWFSADHGGFLASAIVGARYIELPGADHAPYVGATDALQSAIWWFIADTFPSTLASPPGLVDPIDPRLTRRQAQVLQMARRTQ